MAGNFPLHFERKTISQNQTLLSIWSTWNTPLKRYCLFFFSKTRGETHEPVAIVISDHMLIHIRTALTVNLPLVENLKSSFVCSVASHQQSMLQFSQESLHLHVSKKWTESFAFDSTDWSFWKYVWLWSANWFLASILKDSEEKMTLVLSFTLINST